MMEATAIQLDAKIDEKTILETLLDHPNLTLAEIANHAKLLPPYTYEVVKELRLRDLIAVREDDEGTRRYHLLDAGKEILGVPDESEIERKQAEQREEQRTESSHQSSLKKVEALAEFPHSLKEPEQREFVLQAIGEKYGTLDGIKRRVGFPPWFDMTELLAGMTVDHLIRKETQGDITAYFLYEDKPLRFWRIGDGRIDFDRDPSFMPRNEQAKAEELSNKQFILYPEKKKKVTVGDSFEDDFDPDDGLDEPIAKPSSPFSDRVAQNGTSDEGTKKARRGPYKRITLDAASVEKAAAEAKNVEEAAKTLGLSSSGLYLKLNESETLKAAFKRGQATAAKNRDDVGPGKKNGRPMKGEARPQKVVASIARGKGPDIDIAEVERVSAEGMTAKQAAEHFGIALHNFKNYIKAGSGKGQNPAIRDAWYRGRKASASTPAKRSKPAAETPAKRSYKKREKTAEPVVEMPIAEEPAVATGENGTDAAKTTNGPALSLRDLAMIFKSTENKGQTQALFEVAEAMPFNLGNALLHIHCDEIELAIWHLQREQARRTRANA